SQASPASTAPLPHSGWQTLATQLLLVQSLFPMHDFPLAHLPHVPPPPQSRSVSLPFKTPSPQLWHAPAPPHWYGSEHSAAGSRPAVMLVHAPTKPAMLHAWQAPSHAVLQQN